MSNKIKIVLTTVILFSFLFLFMHFKNGRNATAAAAASAAVYSQQVETPLSATDIPMDAYFFPQDSAVDIKRTTGTRIRISPNSFTKKDGSSFSGPVELKVREFHSAEDIMRAGIPMSIDGSRQEFLKSAGMIEVRAYAEGEELEIKAGETIAVDLAVFRPSDGYDLYYLKNDSEWIVPGNFESAENAEKEEKLKRLSEKPARPAFLDTSKRMGFTFELAGNYQYAPYLADFEGWRWRIYGEYNEEEVRRALRINWDRLNIRTIDSVHLIHEFTFTKNLDVDYDGEKMYQTIIFRAVPVIDECDSERGRSLFEAKMKEYQVLLKLRDEELKRLEGEAALFNSFKMDRMGIYNIDTIMKWDDVLYTSARFDFEEELHGKVNRVKLFVILQTDNSVVQFKPDEWSKNLLLTAQSSELIAFLPGDKVAVVSSEQVRQAYRNRKTEVRFNTVKYDANEYFGRKGGMMAKR